MKTQTKISLIAAMTILGILIGGYMTVFAGISTLGDFVWFDENGNGIKDEDGVGPDWRDSGIDGVLINLYIDNGNAIFEPGSGDTLEKSMTTGDNPSTSEIEHGWYDFTDLGTSLGWWVEVADSNFDHGGPLEGYEYTGNNAPNAYNGPEPRFVYLNDGVINYDDADFGYTLKDIVSVGNLVWFDPNNNGIFDANETGINGITVYLFQDENGNGVPEPGAGDGNAISTTTTSQMTINGQTYDGIYQFLNLTPSDANDPTTNYFVALSSADLKAAGYTTSSTGANAAPLDNDDSDDGYPLSNSLYNAKQRMGSHSIEASTYVVSKPFSLTKGGQPSNLATADWGDAVGYADTSSYMTVDFGFFTDPTNAIDMRNMEVDQTETNVWILVAFMGILILAAFIFHRQRNRVTADHIDQA